jgi:hypothetical protein
MLITLSKKLKARIKLDLTSVKYGQELIDAIESMSSQINSLPSGSILAGESILPDGVSVFNVTYPVTLISSNYALTLTISNIVDVTVRHLTPTITGKTITGFTFNTAQTTDHPNYKVNWMVVIL